MSDSKEVRTNALAQKLYDILKNKTGLVSMPSEEQKILKNVLEVISTFGEVLEERGALDLFPKIVAELSTMVTSQLEANTVYVRTPVELDSAQAKKLTEKLSKLFGNDVSVKQLIDKKVSGGLVIEYKDKVIDLSIDKKLEEMKSKLKG